MFDFVQSINRVLWGPWTFFVLMAAGALFTVWTRFVQVRALTHGVQVVRGLYDNSDDPGAISHFQALSAALSATVGLANIGGVALAIALGGPGALFWMWVIGFMGMALKTVEITLALMYRDTSNPDDPHGGAMWVLEQTLGKKGGGFAVLARGLGVFFSATLVLATLTGANIFQAWNVASLTEQYFGVPPIATSVVIALLVGAVIIGGIKRIGQVAGRIVPLMVVIYVGAALMVLAMHAAELPRLLWLVVESAFNPVEATGSFIGAGAYFAFTIGLRRALFSNEAGQGSAPIAHSAAKTAWPAREGVVGGLGPFIDTLVICTITASVILVTGVWHRPPEGELKGAVSFAQTSDATGKIVFQTSGPTSVASLPPLPGGDTWADGNTFYLVAKVPGAARKDSRGNRLRVGGHVEAVGGHLASMSGSGELRVVWDPVELDPEVWTFEQGPPRLQLVNAGVYRAYAGASLTAIAFDSVFPGLGKWLVTIAAWFFAVSTMISWSYDGEQGMIFIAGSRSILAFKLVFLSLTLVAPFVAGDGRELGAMIDFGTGWMLAANLPIVLLLGSLAVRELRDYFRRLHAGEFVRRARATRRTAG